MLWSDMLTERWNGATEKPTLHPSINMLGHWHGWLREGVWQK